MAQHRKSKSKTTSDSRAVGRKRDHLLSGKILDATLDVLADVGANNLTMDLVAARAGSGKGAIYRRWPSKPDLIFAAVDQLKRRHIGQDHLPDTGSLRDDLLALFKPLSKIERQRWGKIMAALTSLVGQDKHLAQATHEVVVKPWAEAHLAMMQRAQERGEISKSADIDTLSKVVPTIAAYRTLVLRLDFDKEFLTTMIDSVLLPAFGLDPIKN